MIEPGHASSAVPAGIAAPLADAAPGEGRITVRQLATLLGLGKTTVAEALRENPRVSPSLRELVLRKARELGYQPNPIASAFLKQIRARTAPGSRAKGNLALILPWSDGHLDLCRGAIRRADELGYSADKISNEELRSDQITRILLARGVLGVAITPLSATIGRLQLDWSRFASVAMGYSLARPQLHRVVHNHLEGIRTAVRMCRRKGRRRIGLALREESEGRSNGLWSGGFHTIQRRLPSADRVAPFLVSDADYTKENIRRWLRDEKPDAVIFHHARLVPDLPELAHGRVVPVVLDRLPGDPFAGIDQQYERTGAMLIDLLSLQILHGQRGLPQRPVITMLDGVWMEPDAAKLAPPSSPSRP